MLKLEQHQPKVKYAIIALIVILVAVVYFVFYQFGRKLGKNESVIQPAGKTEEMTEEQKQLQEIEKIHAQEEKSLKSQEEQLKEMEAIRGQETKPLTEEEKQKQLQEIENLRNLAK